MLYFGSDNNLYFLLMEQEPLNYQALLVLVRELQKDDKIDLSSLPTQKLLQLGINRVVSLQMESKDKKQLIRFCEQLAQAKPIDEMKIYQQTLVPLLKKYTINYILQWQDFMNVLADLFLTIYQKQWKEKKELKDLDLKVKSMLTSIFFRSHHRPLIQKYNEMIKCLQHKIVGWITCKDTQDYIDQYIKRGSQIIGLKQDLLAYQRINRDQVEYMKSCSAALVEKKVALEEMRRKLKVYQSKQIMQANQEEDFDKIDQQFIEKQPSIIELAGYSCDIVLTSTKFAISKQIDIIVQPISCNTAHSESQIGLAGLFVQTTFTQTDEKTYSQTETQTSIRQVTQFTQTEDSIKQSRQVQAHSIQQLFQQHEHLLRCKLRSQALFHGDVFLNDAIYRQILIKHIQEKGRRVIRQTRMIYRYDPLNDVNFHRYIDNVQGLAFVVKTISGMYLAGFYSGKLVPDKVLNQFGLIISLNNDESYTLLDSEKGKTHRSMVYDNFYAIFGNAQLRVKTGQDFIFSNFGIMNAYFNHQGRKVNDFLGDNINREAKFEMYEFYQVLFEQ